MTHVEVYSCWEIMDRLLSRRDRGVMVPVLFFNDFNVYYKISSGSPREWLSEQKNQKQSMYDDKHVTFSLYRKIMHVCLYVGVCMPDHHFSSRIALSYHDVNIHNLYIPTPSPLDHSVPA